ncbi:MAG: hypothetical protein IJE89_02580 [Bacilli bacterium]|nr:hypothetical protein [Bacilli bacterium]
MKKIILILFLFLSCYLIYNLTEDNNISCLVLGDKIGDNIYIKENELITEYNNTYVNKDYRIIDLINIIKYNEELEVNNNEISIHRLMKNTDILVLSIGMNDIYSKLNDNIKDIYTYMNNMVNNMETLLSLINKYNYKEVIVLGYYNITNKNNDIFTYLNYKMKKIVEKNNSTYIELNNILKNNPKFYENSNNFNLNSNGYSKINEIIVENLKKY